MDYNRGANTKQYWNEKHLREYIKNENPIIYEKLDDLSYHKIACDIIVNNEVSINNKSLLEIGCADGKFINLMNKKLPSWKMYGFDFGNVAIEFAQINYANNDVQFYDVDIMQEKLIYDYGVICMFEVIEHMPEEKNYEIINQLLEHCEYLILSTPTTKDNCFGEHISHYDFDAFDRKGYNVIWKIKLDKIDMSNVGDYNDYWHILVLIKGKL